MGLSEPGSNACSEGLGTGDGPMEGKLSAVGRPSILAPGASTYDIAGVNIGNGWLCTCSCPMLTTRLAVPPTWSCCCSGLCRSGSGRQSNPWLVEAIASVNEVWSMDGVLSELTSWTAPDSVEEEEDAMPPALEEGG